LEVHATSNFAALDRILSFSIISALIDVNIRPPYFSNICLHYTTYVRVNQVKIFGKILLWFISTKTIDILNALRYYGFNL
ncbi:MAG: hypothetical protein E6X33_13280, partial [Agathobacter rectalis]|nr:hypothetical protein [Agathobacter rectalis]